MASVSGQPQEHALKQKPMVLHNRTCSVGFFPLIPPGADVEVLHVWKSFVLSVQIREQMPSYSTVVMENRKM